MKFKKFIPLFALGISILIATITRFYKLGEAPSGLYLDEAAQGYNAYSILKTGKDEFGKSFPIVFRSFTDFKTPVYIYLIVPLINVFGLTKFTVRFPSFLFSILTLPVLYLLLKRITPAKYAAALISLSVLLLSISPWHILFGRTNFECNVALLFFLTGVLFFYKGLEKPKNLLLSALLFGIAIPSYHAQRVVTPLIMILLFFRHKKIILSKSHIKFLISGLIIGFFILIPTLSISTTPGFLARAGLNIFSYQKQKPAGYLESCNEGYVCTIANNRLYLHTKEFAALYVSYFSPRNMFVLGDYGPRSSFPGLSTFFLWQFPFYLLGLFYLFKSKDLGELRFFVITLLLISPIPAAITRDPYTTIRALQMVIPQTIIISLGLFKAYKFGFIISRRYFSSNIYYSAISFLSVCVLCYTLLKLYSSVLILNEYYRASEWNYGFEEVAAEITKFDQELPVAVDNARTEPYSQLLFFLKFDPETYQKDNFEVPLKEYYTNMNRNTQKVIGNITTRPIFWKDDLMINQYLIGDYLAISNEQIENNKLTLIKEVKYPNGSPIFRIVKTNPEFEKAKKQSSVKGL